MAPVVPIRQADQQMTNPMRRVDASPDAFGAGIGRALVSMGGNIQQVGDAFKQEEEKQAQSNVTDAINQYSSEWRKVMLDPEKGLMNREGKSAAGITPAAEETSQTVMATIAGTLKTDDEKKLFSQAISRRVQSDLDGVANYEFKQAQAYREETKVSLLDNTQADVVMHYKDPKALAADFDLARSIIRTNVDRLSPEGVEKLERQGISSLHLSVIDRLSQDNPGDALDYYEKNKAEIEGKDHAAANSIVKGVAVTRDVKSFVDQTASDGRSISIFQAIEKGESEGNAGAVSDAGALGLMQLMPNTAREVAAKSGLRDVAAMDDAQLHEFFTTDAGKKVNRQLGTRYFSDQLAEFDGDLEASLIAYNAGPGNARKWLNAGRDYNALPKASETLPYVRKVLGAYTGIDLGSVKDEDGSRGIQDAINPKQPGVRYSGDSKAFLRQKLVADKSPADVDDLNPVMTDSLAALMNSAPDGVKSGLGILSGRRSPERQAAIISKNMGKYGFKADDRRAWLADVESVGAVEAGQKWADRFSKSGMRKNIAIPGRSQHQDGDAVDLSWNGDYFSKAPKEVQDWVHANAKRFGLNFPMGHEPWHIEVDGARKGDRPTKDGILRERMGITEDRPTTVVSDGVGPSPAALYTETFKPYTVQATKSSLEDQIAMAETKFADNPVALAEATRQLTRRHQIASAEQKESVDKLQQQLYAEVLSGKSVSDIDRTQLLRVGEDNVGKLMKIEEKFRKADNPDETDEASYVELSRMTPEELRNVNIMDYADRLSRADLKTWADRQAAATRPATRDQTSAGMRTRTQIIGGAVDTLGLDPKPGSADAKTVALLDRSVDERISAFAAENGRAPDALEIQKIVDQLVLEGTVKGSGWISDDTKRVFELTPEERGNFYPGDDEQYASGFADIPIERQQAVANVFSKVYPSSAGTSNEEGYTTTYNDMVRIEQGAAPAPPDDLAPQIKQMFAKKYGRAPTLDEQAAIYRRLILKAAGQ